LIGAERLAGRDLTLPLVAGGSLLLFIVALGIGYAAPMLNKSTTAEGGVTTSKQVAHGRTLYDTEGCWYCHTQSVRPVGGDVGLGTVTAEPKSDHGRPPSGMDRVGPDLSCVGDRVTDADEVVGRLRNPRSSVRASVMPSYRYLSSGDLADLSAYIASLKCV
jgi:cbb3-type cytochrome c oxidase subunit II